MPLSGIVAKPRIVELVQAIRRHPGAAYAVAIGLVALATLARWAMGDYGGGEISFITFFPAIIIATLIGGLWPGVCAIIFRCSRHGICSFHPPLVSSWGVANSFSCSGSSFFAA